MKKLLSALFVLALASSAAWANLPDATKCTVLPWDNLNGTISAPDSPAPIAASIGTLTIRNSSNNPINNAICTVEFPAPTNIRYCTSANNSGTTNTLGQTVITLRGGGCKVGAGVALVKANGSVIRTYNAAKSPDWDGAAASGTMNLSDLLAFKSLTVGCHDYDNSGTMTLTDLLIFTSAYVPGHSCTLQP
jgi:hypothetical protein